MVDPVAATALLARARYAHHSGERIYLDSGEWAEISEGRPPPDRSWVLTLYGVPVGIDAGRAAEQIAQAIAHPAPPMDWETEPSAQSAPLAQEEPAR